MYAEASTLRSLLSFQAGSNNFYVPIYPDSYRWYGAYFRIKLRSAVVSTGPAPRGAVGSPWPGVSDISMLVFACQFIFIGNPETSICMPGIDFRPRPNGYAPASDVREWLDDYGESWGQSRETGASDGHSSLQCRPDIHLRKGNWLFRSAFVVRQTRSEEPRGPTI